MRSSILLAMIALSSVASAQTDPRDLFDDHRIGKASNGATRIDQRVGAPVDNKPATSAPLVQPANSGVHVYTPRSLNDLAREIVKKPQ
jgi:hypothetical protein